MALLGDHLARGVRSRENGRCRHRGPASGRQRCCRPLFSTIRRVTGETDDRPAADATSRPGRVWRGPACMGDASAQARRRWPYASSRLSSVVVGPVLIPQCQAKPRDRGTAQRRSRRSKPSVNMFVDLALSRVSPRWWVSKNLSLIARVEVVTAAGFANAPDPSSLRLCCLGGRRRLTGSAPPVRQRPSVTNHCRRNVTDAVHLAICDDTPISVTGDRLTYNALILNDGVEGRSRKSPDRDALFGVSLAVSAEFWRID